MTTLGLHPTDWIQLSYYTKDGKFKTKKTRAGKYWKDRKDLDNLGFVYLNHYPLTFNGKKLKTGAGLKMPFKPQDSDFEYEATE
jgi:hypothetical protein